jgi:predicted metal-binding membrane protein
VLDARIEAVLRRDRAITLAGVVALAGLAWLYLARLAREMADMAEMGMAQTGPWAFVDALLATVMWAVMMVAMMVPAATPMVLVFATVNRKRRADGAPHVNTALFVAGYLVVWACASAAAAAAQWALHEAALLSPTLLATTPLLGGALLVAAGVYQLTPLKYACLSRCQSPLGFLLTGWRDGNAGALVMGLRHGLWCLGCCWLLMLLLFVGGVMNLAWAAAITAFVLAEKLLPGGRLVSWVAGVVLIAWGGVMLAPHL